MMTEAEYCSTVCKAMCCYQRLEMEGSVRCPRLTDDCRCSVYSRRYAEGMPEVVAVGTYRSRAITDLSGSPAIRTFFCGTVKNLHAGGGLPQEIADRCCVLKPELLLGEKI